MSTTLEHKEALRQHALSNAEKQGNKVFFEAYELGHRAYYAGYKEGFVAGCKTGQLVMQEQEAKGLKHDIGWSKYESMFEADYEAAYDKIYDVEEDVFHAGFLAGHDMGYDKGRKNTGKLDSRDEVPAFDNFAKREAEFHAVLQLSAAIFDAGFNAALSIYPQIDQVSDEH